MKIGIVGCGLNSDYHINFAQAYAGAEIVGVVDRDASKAQECASKFKIPGVYSSIKELVDQTKPDVIHIISPPQTHCAVAKEALSLNCHVLVEKPLALSLQEAKEVYDMAEQRGVKLCTMHNHFFDPCMLKALNLIQEGQVGRIMNVESYYGLNTEIAAFRYYPAPNVLPWLYNLPKGVYQDFMAHPLYVMLDFTGKPKEIKVMQQSHGVLPQNMPDELRIMINGEKALGTLTFSFAARPHLHFVRIYGTKMMVEVDINTMTTVVHPLSSLPKAAQKATYNLSESWQLLKATTSNVVNFVRGKLKPYHGMKTLIHAFYDSIKNNTEPPVTKEQGLRVMETMDEIWRQMDLQPLDFTPVIRREFPYPLKHKEKVLVTGGTGFLGKRMVELLVKEGYPVRVLARKLSKTERLRELGVEIFFGDIADQESLKSAFEGIDVVVHAAAGTSGSRKDSETGTIQGTQNVIKLCGESKVKKMIYISSCSVYGVADYKTGQVVTEESSLERFPAQRGVYSASKQRAEELVMEAMKSASFPVVILRPGTIFGPRGEIYTPMMGFSMKNKAFVVIGMGKFELPFVYIDNIIDAIIQSIQRPEANNQIFNVVDTEKVTKRQYIEKVVKKVYSGSPVIYFPYPLLYSITWLQEVLFGILKTSPFLTRYRLVSSQKNIRYDNSRIADRLQWSPGVSFNEAASAIIDYERSK
jgi:2-alkyl-3-oxoalkanoate reductase